MRKIDELDVINIKKEAMKEIKANTGIRLGQAVVIVTQRLFPNAERKLKFTDFDCFYSDSRIELYLKELQKLNAE